MAEKPPQMAGPSPMAAAPCAEGRRTLGARLVRISFWVLLALLLVTAGTVFVASRTMTLQWAAQQAMRFTDGRLQIEGITGSVLSEVAADAVRWQDGEVSVTITSPRFVYHPLALLDGLVRVERISAADVQVELPPVPPPGQPRQPLRLAQGFAAMPPMAVERIDAGRVIVRRGPDELARLHNLEAVFRHDGDRFNASLLNLDIVAGQTRAGMRGEVAVLARAPYATDGRFAVRTPMQPEPLRVDLRINGPLEELSVRATTAIAGAPVEARTILRPLDPRPLRQVRVDVKDFDVSRYDPTLPATRLTGSYEAEVMPAWAKESKPLLIGPLNLANSMAGSLDRKRLPVSAAKAVVGLSGGRLEIQGLQTTGPLGEFSGDGWIEPESFRLALASDKLLLRGIDSTLAPRTVSARIAVEPIVDDAAPGPLSAGTIGSRAAMTLEATASDAALAAELRGVLTGGRLHISRAHLQSKPGAGTASAGRATFSGTVGVAAPWPVDLSGEFQQFDPAQLITMPGALLNGTWRLAGRSEGVDGGRFEAAATLAESRLQGLPLAGKLAAVLTVGEAGLQRLSSVQAALNWGSGTLKASGALGNPPDALRLDLNLPKVDDVLSGMTGTIEAQAILRGGLRDPAVEATLDGSRLVATAGGVRTSIAAATVQLKSATVRDGPLKLQSRLDDVAVVRVATGGYAMSAAAGSVMRFEQVSAALDGSRASHDLDLIATGKEQHLTLSARGGLADDGLWRGVVNEFAASHPWLDMPGRAPGRDAARAMTTGPGTIRASTARSVRGSVPVSVPGSAFGSTFRGTTGSTPGSTQGSTRGSTQGNTQGSAPGSAPGSARAAGVASYGGVPYQLQSLGPFTVTAGADRLSARGASFDFQGALLKLKQADWRESVLTLSADASAVPAGWLGRFMSADVLNGGSFRPPTVAAPAAVVDWSLAHDLRLAATFDFHGDVADTSAAAWRGRLDVMRESGDLSIEGPDGAGATGAGLRILQASAVLDSRDLAMVVNVDGENIGRMAAEARTTLQAAARPPWAEASLALSPLGGTVDLATSSFRWISPLVGGSWRVDGALSARLQLAGTLTRPRADGFVTGNNLSAQEQALGMRLDNGVLAAELAGGRIDVKVLRFESEEGSVAIGGLLQPPGSGRSEAHLVIDRLPVPLGPGQRVVLSGSTAAVLKERSLDITGRLVADEGHIDLNAGAAPEEAGDLAIRRSRVGGMAVRAGLPDASLRPSIRRTAAGAGGAAASTGGSRIVARSARAFGMDTDIRIDLGRRLRVSGSDLEGYLKGVIRLQSSFPEAPEATGAVDVVDGVYQVQGRKLKIRRGRLIFDGSLDNPTLDIVAVREHPRIESGFAVGGTALAPVAKLISNPEVADADKLAWLVLGTGLRDAQGLSQMLALQSAAANLFGEDGARYALGFAGKPAVDLLSVREQDGRAVGSGVGPSDVAQGGAASVGSRLSSRLFATCEQSLRSVWNILKLQFEITDRLSLSVQAGSDSAAELLGFYPFD